MEVAHSRQHAPRSLGLLGGEDIGVAHRPLLVGSQQGIEAPVVVLQRRGPLSPAVDGAILQVVLRRVGQPVEDIAHGLPVLQVLRGHDRRTRHQMHGSRHQIEGVAHTDDIRIGHIRPQHRVMGLWIFMLSPVVTGTWADSCSRLPVPMTTAINNSLFLNNIVIYFLKR